MKKEKAQRSNKNFLQYIERVSPINPKSITLFEEHRGVKCQWGNQTKKRNNSIYIFFGPEPFQYSEVKNKLIVYSNFQSEVTNEGYRNPFDGLKVIFTLIATIQEISNKLGKIIHIARANKYSKPLYEMLVNMNLYYYCDEQGNKVSQPQLLADKLNLYAAVFPNPEFRILQKYRIKSYSKELLMLHNKVQRRNKIKKLLYTIKYHF